MNKLWLIIFAFFCAVLGTYDPILDIGFNKAVQIIFLIAFIGQFIFLIIIQKVYVIRKEKYLVTKGFKGAYVVSGILALALIILSYYEDIFYANKFSNFATIFDTIMSIYILILIFFPILLTLAAYLIDKPSNKIKYDWKRVKALLKYYGFNLIFLLVMMLINGVIFFGISW